jgi:hypothetical protein
MEERGGGREGDARADARSISEDDLSQPIPASPSHLTSRLQYPS